MPEREYTFTDNSDTEMGRKIITYMEEILHSPPGRVILTGFQAEDSSGNRVGSVAVVVGPLELLELLAAVLAKIKVVKAGAETATGHPQKMN